MKRSLHCALVGAAALAGGAACSNSAAPDVRAEPVALAPQSVKPDKTPTPLPPKPPAVNPDCRSLPNPVYLATTTLLDTLMRKVGPVLADSSAAGVGSTDQMTVIQFPQASCLAYEALNQNSEISGTGVYFDAGNPTPLNCDLPTGTGVKADMVAMDVGGATCLGTTAPAALHEFPAHVEPLGFVVPKNSTQTSITATEAYYLMKFGGATGMSVAPWTDPNFIHVRTGGSSTQLTIGVEIRVPGTMWSSLLQSNGGSGAVQAAVVADNTNGNAEKSIGILDSSKYEASLDNLRVLAFQPFNQCIGAVYPDSTSASRDKRNVRDGHYPLWTHMRYIMEYQGGVPFSDNGQASADRTKKFIDIMTSTITAANLDVVLDIVQTGNVPGCAMHATRDYDGGEIKPLDNPTPCDCYFEAHNNVTNPACVTCTDTCASGVCRLGYCEPK